MNLEESTERKSPTSPEKEDGDHVEETEETLVVVNSPVKNDNREEVAKTTSSTSTQPVFPFGAFPRAPTSTFYSMNLIANSPSPKKDDTPVVPSTTSDTAPTDTILCTETPSDDPASTGASQSQDRNHPSTPPKNTNTDPFFNLFTSPQYPANANASSGPSPQFNTFRFNFFKPPVSTTPAIPNFNLPNTNYPALDAQPFAPVLEEPSKPFSHNSSRNLPPAPSPPEKKRKTSANHPVDANIHIELFFRSVCEQTKQANLTPEEFVDFQRTILTIYATTLANRK